MAIQLQSIEELVQQQPFRSFRIHTAGGKDYLVTDPQLVVPMRTEIFYAFANKDRWAIIPLSHITSIEIEQAA